MAFPATVATRQVSIGIPRDSQWNVDQASVNLRPMFDVAVDTTTGDTVRAVATDVVLNAATPTQTVELLASDTPGLTVTGFDWRVTWRAPGIERSYRLRIPRWTGTPGAAPVLDLDLLTPVTTSAGGTVSVPVVTPDQLAAALAGLGGGGASDASVAALVTGTGATRTALDAAYGQRWKANTAYLADAVVISPEGRLVKAKVDFTSGATYAASNWTVIDDAYYGAKAMVDAHTTALAAAGTTFARKLQYVSAYQGIATDFATNQNQTMSFRHSHKIVADVTDVRLVIPLGAKLTNTQTAADVLSPAAVPVKASLTLGGVARPVLFRGAQRQVNNDPGGTLVSDAISADLPAGTIVPVWTAHAVTGSLPYPNAICTGQGPGFTTSGDGYTAGSDATDGTGNAAIGNTSQWTPHGLVGIPAAPVPAWLGSGDSITAGTGDTGFTNGGWLARACNANYPLLRLAVGGNSAQGVAAQHSYTWPLVDYCTHAAVLFGANDLTPGNARTAVQLIADLTAIYTGLRRRGLKVYGATILPRTVSNTNMSPIGSGFAAGASSPRGQVNAWIRTGGGGLLHGYFETADAVETGRDTGVWASGMTTDGAHPTVAGHTAMAAVVNLGAIAAAWIASQVAA